MKFKQYTIYILASLLTACTVQYNLQSHSESSFDVKSASDSAIAAIIAPYKARVDSVMDKVLCISDVEMKKGKPESLLGNFVCDLCLKRYSDIADICIMNTGGLRSTLPKGKITRGDIFKLMPFENELVVLELEEKDYLEMLQYITKRGGEPFAGTNISMDKNGNAISQSFDLSKGKIRVLTSDYLANGGDKMSFFQGKEQNLVGEKLRDAILNYCISKDTISSKLDNRLIIVE